MNEGQMIMSTLPVNAPLLTTVTGSHKMQPLHDGAQGSGGFAGVLNGMTPKAAIRSKVDALALSAKKRSQADVVTEALPPVARDMKTQTVLQPVARVVQPSCKVGIENVISEPPEKNDEEKQTEGLIPQDVVVNAAWAQPAQVLQMAGRMPESNQNVANQLDNAAVSELPAEPAVKAVPATPAVHVTTSETAEPALHATPAESAVKAVPATPAVHVTTSETAEPALHATPAEPAIKVVPATPAEHTTAATPSLIETGNIPTQAVLKMNDGRPVVQEEQQQRPATTDLKTTANAGNVFSGAVEVVAAATTAEDSWSNGKSLSDRAMGAQLHQAAQQQNIVEVVAPAPPTVSTSVVAEEVVKQVSEHFAKHEIKGGSEQIVLRLSPDNLGELRVNLKMEGHRLTVEIVTENRMARDAIIQNSDTLKESLARQNIRMDSFDVSSGGNSNDSLAGRSGRNMNEWQEMTREKQEHQWMQGGYNVPKDFIPEKLAYNPHTEYEVLDVHF